MRMERSRMVGGRGPGGSRGSRKAGGHWLESAGECTGEEVRREGSGGSRRMCRSRKAGGQGCMRISRRRKGRGQGARRQQGNEQEQEARRTGAGDRDKV